MNERAIVRESWLALVDVFTHDRQNDLQSALLQYLPILFLFSQLSLTVTKIGIVELSIFDWFVLN